MSLLKNYCSRMMVLLALGGLLGACSDDDDASTTNTFGTSDKAQIRVIHASADSPDVNVNLNGAQALSNLTFSDGSAYLSIDPGTASIQVLGITPGGEASVIGPADFQFEGGAAYTVVAYDNLTGIKTLFFSETAAVASDMARVRVAHLAPAAPAVDIHVTGPDDELSNATVTLGNVEFAALSDGLELAPASYRIRITVAGDVTQVVFDSGTIAIAAGNDLFIGAVTNTKSGASPVALIVHNGEAASTIYDQNAGADIRVVHAAAAVGNVDVYLGDNTTPSVSNLAFQAVTDGYLNVPAGTYTVKITAAGGDPAAPLISEDVTVAANESYSVVALNATDGIEAFVEQRRRISTEAQVMIIHASQNAGAVDIYVTAPEAGIETINPNFEGVSYIQSTGFVTLPGASYDIAVTPTTTKVAAIAANNTAFADGGLYTILARDGANPGDDLGFIVISDAP